MQPSLGEQINMKYLFERIQRMKQEFKHGNKDVNQCIRDITGVISPFKLCCHVAAYKGRLIQIKIQFERCLLFPWVERRHSLCFGRHDAR